jgi:hypothetical protein
VSHVFVTSQFIGTFLVLVYLVLVLFQDKVCASSQEIIMQRHGVRLPRPDGTLASQCYISVMTKTQVKEILDRVLTWPPERQADVARVVELMEKQDSSTLRLTGEQAAEVRRRLAEPTAAQTIPAEEVFRRLRSS